jgi:signal transduction histidine kinase
MRTVYTKALLWALGILLLSLGGFLAISRTMAYDLFAQGTPIARNANMQFDEAKRAFQRGGRDALAVYVDAQNQAYPNLQFFFLRNGRDLVDGVDRSRFLEIARSRWGPLKITSPFAIAVPSPESEYVFLVTRQPSWAPMQYLPYYLLILGAITLLCWGLAFQLASPLNRLAETVRRFGAGDLSARVGSRRHDEIGDVARAFDQMADRIESLLTAERRLLQDISHELKSPLGRLSFATELARTSADREGALARVDKEIDRLTGLVQSLLDVTRAEGDFSARNLETVALDALVRDLVQDCEIEAAARPCQLILKGSSRLELLADPELLRRAIDNIFRNAISHAPPGSSIEITLNATAATASVSVRDYGHGVPAEDLTQIFKPFFRVDSSRNSATGGVGLGLAIAQRAIHEHHGHIWAENAEPGLRVCVDLPLEHPAR